VSTSYPVIRLRGPCGRLADGVEGPPSLDPATDVRGLLAHPDRAGRLRRRPVLPVHRRQMGPREPRIRPRRGDRVPDRAAHRRPQRRRHRRRPGAAWLHRHHRPRRLRRLHPPARRPPRLVRRAPAARPARVPQPPTPPPSHKILRTVGERAGVDRKTARRYVAAAEAAGLSREAGLGALTDELIGAVVAAVRPARPDGHGSAWEGALAWAGRSVSRAVDLHERGGAGDGNRTRVASLEDWGSTIELRPRGPHPGTGGQGSGQARRLRSDSAVQAGERRVEPGSLGVSGELVAGRDALADPPLGSEDHPGSADGEPGEQRRDFLAGS